MAHGAPTSSQRSKRGLTILGVEIEVLIKDAASALLADGLDPACVDLIKSDKD